MTQQAAPRVTPAAAPKAASSKYVLTILFLVMMLNFIDRQIITILAEAIKVDLGLSDSQIGLMTGLSFALFYTTLGIPLAAVADRWNRSKLIALAISIWSVMTILCGLAANFIQLFLARCGVGIGEAGSSPASHSLIADLFPPEKRSGALGVLGMAVPIGAFVAYTGGGWMVENLGWRWALIIAGAPGLLLGLVIWITVPDPKGDRSIKHAFRPAPGETSLKQAMAELSRKPAYWYLVVSGIIIQFIAYGMASFYAGFFVRVFDIGYTELGIKLGIVTAISGGFGAWVGGRVGDWMNRKTPAGALIASAAALVLAVPGIYFMVYAPTANMAFLLLAIPTFAYTFYYGPNFAAIQTLATDQTRAMAPAIWLFFTGLLGLGLGPLFVGSLSDYFAGGAVVNNGAPLQKAIAITGLFSLVGAFCFWRAQVWIAKHLPHQSAPHTPA